MTARTLCAVRERVDLTTREPCAVESHPVTPERHRAPTPYFVRCKASRGLHLPMYALIPGALPGGWHEDVRLAHVNAAELSTVDGTTATAAVEAWLARPQNAILELLIYGREKYGRLLADVNTGDGLLSTYVLSLAGTRPMALLHQLATPTDVLHA